jgi:hypothetical protein
MEKQIEHFHLLRSNLKKAGIPVRDEETVSKQLVNKNKEKKRSNVLPVQKESITFGTEKQFERKKKQLNKKTAEADKKEAEGQVKASKRKKKTIIETHVKKPKKEPPGIPCYTLRVNGKDLNKEPEMESLIGNYIHYPISRINKIDNVRMSNIKSRIKFKFN